MSFTETYGGDFLTPELVKFEKLANRTVTIQGISLQDFEKNGKTWKRFVASFNETPKRLLLNKKNGSAIADAYGDDESQWAGKKVMLVLVKDAGIESIQVVIPS